MKWKVADSESRLGMTVFYDFIYGLLPKGIYNPTPIMLYCPKRGGQTNMNKNEMVGKRVRAIVEGNFESREGKVTSIGNAVLPIHVTLDGDNWETDFRADELEVI